MEVLDLNIFTGEDREIKIGKVTLSVPSPEDIPFGIVLEEMKVENTPCSLEEKITRFQEVLLKIILLKNKDITIDIFSGLGIKRFQQLQAFMFGYDDKSKKEPAVPVQETKK